MAENTLEHRLEDLADQIRLLQQRVEDLEGLPVAPGRSRWGEGPAVRRATVSAPDAALPGTSEDVSEEILSWASKAALLPRLSTLCFLLVAALILRTITDYNMINKLLGSALGMGYAAALIGAGWYNYRRQSRLAPVFTACGGVLMSIIVVETHSRFLSLPLVPAYMTLIATGGAMAVISYQFNVFVPISLGTLGMCLAGAAIDYPDPFFPYLSLVLWTANLLGYFAARLQRCSWLRWTLLAVTMLMISQWGVKLAQVLFRGELPPPALALNWFLPVVAVFAGTYAGITLLGILRDRAAGISRFDFFIPTVNVSFTYAISSYVVIAWGAGIRALGWTGIICALTHFGIAFWLAVRKPAVTAGANSFLLAAATLLALSLPGATGHFLLTLPALAVTAFFLIILSRQWDNGGTRAISYLVQIYATGGMAVYLQRGTAATDLLTVIPAGLVAVASLYHYQLARRSSPPETSSFFSTVDRHDRSAVLLLLAALASGFFMLRAVAYQALAMMPGDLANSFRCAQSMLITVAAAVLMLVAVRRRNREIRNVAILITVVGAVKVFLYDMLGTHGVPQVLSIFTFGLVAALQSVALGRWPKAVPAPGAAEPGGERPEPVTARPNPPDSDGSIVL